MRHQDTVTITADIASDLIPSADGTHDLGATGAEWQDLFIDGTANIDSLVADTADINGGSVDGVTIGTNRAVNDLRVDNIKVDGNTVSSTDTNGNINLSPNGTGTVVINTDLDVDNLNINGNTIISMLQTATSHYAKRHRFSCNRRAFASASRRQCRSVYEDRR